MEKGWGVEKEIFSAFPLYPFCLVGAVAIQWCLARAGPCAVIALDRGTMEGIAGAVMDALVTVAILSLDVANIASHALVPFTIAFVACLIWSVLALVLFARCLPDYRVERALTETGLALGATASALLVLRMAPPTRTRV